MKTVEQWLEQFKADGDGEFEPSEMIEYIKSFVMDIQKDAQKCSFVAMERALRHIDLDNVREARRTLIKALGLLEIKPEDKAFFDQLMLNAATVLDLQKIDIKDIQAILEANKPRE